MENYIEEVLYSEKDILDAVKRIAKEIEADYQGKKPVLVGLLKGSVPFLAELIKYINLDIQIDFMKVSSYSGAHSTGSVRILSDTSNSLRGRDVILVEDIVDTGLTITEVYRVLEAKGANSISICTLCDKKEARVYNTINPRYIGFEIPDKFIVGFGLDYNELYRNLPYIGVLKKEIYS